MIFLDRDFEDRVEHIVDCYGRNWDEEALQHFLEKLELLKKYLSSEQQQELIEAAKQTDLRKCVRQLLSIR